MKKKDYSRWINSTMFVIDFLIITLLIQKYVAENALNVFVLNIFWLGLSLSISFQKRYQYTGVLQILRVLIKRFSLFTLLTLSYFYLINFKLFDNNVYLFLFFTYFLINTWRVIADFIIRKYKPIFRSELTKVVILGSDDTTKKLQNFFKNYPEHNYLYVGFFTNKDEKNKIGNFNDCFNFINEHEVDEICCSVKEWSNHQITQLIYFADNNLKTLKFIPDNKYFFSKKLQFENYDLIPILSLSDIPLKNYWNSVAKRIFDITFSLAVIIGFLSWFTPIIALLIKLESNGEVFFKQLRYGADFNLFACYKFRSMGANDESDKVQASKNDMRVTKVGKFIRKTSIDELPQFYNVLFGSMSVVGPRPLLLSHTDNYKNKINKFMVRHTVKPGITGLAQVSGYRGNIEKELDMQNRVKYDLFYIENWSLFLDLKIIVKTLKNVIHGEEKAY